MNKSIFFTVASLLVWGNLLRGQTPVEFSVTAELSAARTDYLLGEPILLQLTTVNKGRSPIETSPLAVDRIATEVATDNQGFRRVDPTITYPHLVGDSVLIDPGKAKTFPAIVGVDYRRLGRYQLGLPEPGTYSIRVVSPFWKPDSNEPTYSTNVQVRVRRPVGDDLKIFDEFKTGDDFGLLQTGGYTKENILFLMQFLEKYPATGYRAALHRSLMLTVRACGVARVEAILTREERERLYSLMKNPVSQSLTPLAK